MLQPVFFLLLALASFSFALSQKNVLVIMADDQDMLLDSMSVMPNVVNVVGKQGVTYNKHYCTVAWCCPSRVNFLTGRAAHNTNVTALSAPYGGWPKFKEEGLNENYLPVWIKNAGIRTYYIGKFMNGFGVKNYMNPGPKSWDHSSFLLDPWTYNYHHSHWSNDYLSKVSKFPGVHTTHVTQQKALAALDDAAQHDQPFFMMVAPVAPHVEIAGGVHAPPPPDSQKGNFLNRQAPRRPNFNPDKASGASWIKKLPKLGAADVATCDENQVGRLQNIAGIDLMVAQLVDKLKVHNMLEDTYIIYTSDNGFHIGNHRLLPGKRCPYEEDINIPLLIRGPDVPKGVTTSMTNDHTDMAPTILKMLGVPLRPDFDGAAVAYTSDAIKARSKTTHEHVSVEFWDAGKPDGYRGSKANLYYDNTYKALRLVNFDNSFYYSVWCTNEHEFYDMKTDFNQMTNRLAKDFKGSAKTYYGRPQQQLINRLDAVLLVTKGCKQDSCRNPWHVLFPGGRINGLKEAMLAQYDTFFANQPKVSFSSCKDGHQLAHEGPRYAHAFGAGS